MRFGVVKASDITNHPTHPHRPPATGSTARRPRPPRRFAYARSAGSNPARGYRCFCWSGALFRVGRKQLDRRHRLFPADRQVLCGSAPVTLGTPLIRQRRQR